MRRSALLGLLAALTGGCTLPPLALLGREAATERPGMSSGEPVVLSPSTEIAEPPAAPAPMQGDADIGDGAFRREQAKGLEGDRDAAYRVAMMFKEGSSGVPRDERRMVRWLRHASELDNGLASYQLYLHYLARGLDRDAVRYENRALRQGFMPPPRLDPRRG